MRYVNKKPLLLSVITTSIEIGYLSGNVTNLDFLGPGLDEFELDFSGLTFNVGFGYSISLFNN